MRRARHVTEVVVATTTERTDDPLAELCRIRGWPWFRGDENDVLDRYYRPAEHFAADLVVRITSDCPMIDPAVINQVIQEYLDRQPGVDYASNINPRRTYPRGLDTEVFGFELLAQAWREAKEQSWREHVTPFMYRQPERFRLHCVVNDTDYSALRLTVDTPEDLELVRRVYEEFGNDRFSWLEAVELLDKHPDWLELNRHVEQKAV